jgi:TetR/AcrR family transcriptional regulator, cholesterol catabolism regulator
MRRSADQRSDAILDVVVDLLETEGYDAVQVRTVARRARISLTTLYQHFGTLDQLILAALERWMQANAYSEITMPGPDESPYEVLVRIMHTVFEPWLKNPRMLEAYHHARSRPGGEQLVIQGMGVVMPIVHEVLPHVDAEYLRDAEMIHSHVTRAAIARFAQGEIAITDIVPLLERALFRLMTDNRLGTAVSEPSK